MIAARFVSVLQPINGIVIVINSRSACLTFRLILFLITRPIGRSTSIPVTSKCNYWHLYDTLENKPMGKATKIYPTFPSGGRFRFHVSVLPVDPLSYICRCSFNQSLCLLATIARLSLRSPLRTTIQRTEEFPQNFFFPRIDIQLRVSLLSEFEKFR